MSAQTRMSLPALAHWRSVWQRFKAQQLHAWWEQLPPPARQLLARLGWPGLFATLLSLLALALLLWGLPAQDRALQRQREALSERRLALKELGQRSLTESPQAFLQSLPEDSERQARTAALLALSTEMGLPWPRSEFRYQAEPGLGLAQYKIAMNASGNYEQIRRYVQEALRRDPALSLESIKLRRLRPAAPDLSAELAWVLHMQMPPQPNAAPHTAGLQR
ncbi:hypothetical protein WG899_09215 [Paucibacter sp. AS339]|uniref:hypothetical protein n=1 Tax=Paucibacter hankyongi TaxID=3133434 RepID=UPI0030A24955